MVYFVEYMFYYITDSNSPRAQQELTEPSVGIVLVEKMKVPALFFKGMTPPCFRAVVQAPANAIVLKNKHVNVLHCLHTSTNEVLRF